jgi:hypothetical protein
MKIDKLKLTQNELCDAVEQWLGDHGVAIEVTDVSINEYADKTHPVLVEAKTKARYVAVSNEVSVKTAKELNLDPVSTDKTAKDVEL